VESASSKRRVDATVRMAFHFASTLKPHSITMRLRLHRKHWHQFCEITDSPVNAWASLSMTSPMHSDIDHELRNPDAKSRFVR
jgi:hypothetical protein